MSTSHAVPPADERATITVEEAAQALGLGRSAGYNAVRAGQIPALRVGRRWLVPTAALHRMLAEGGK